MEKAICGNNTVSKLDEELSDTYKITKVKLSLEAQKIFTEGQKNWIKFISKSCFYDLYGKANKNAEIKECLESEYKSRIESFKLTDKTITGFKVYSYFDGDFQSFPKNQERSYQKIEVTLIDDNSEVANLINQKNKPKKIEIECDSCRDATEISISLSELNSDLIKIERYESNSGGAHPDESTGSEYFSKQLKRPLKLSDIFINADWKKVAQKIAKKHFETEGTMEDVTRLEITLDQNDVFTYSFADKGFYITGFTSYAARAVDGVDMPWELFVKFLTPKGKELSQLKQKK